ncbi:MAG TPA: CHASE3 domain-containing protein [Nitrospira sp.]|nr:CHASE3 domain-containing protein [Nitrospira sp.]MBS0173626.1 CHASE3 domain-containing protein [Nitrospira sp.]MBX3336880.1 CHASE3 domain-containing protein [Nitrospira sp.]MCW5779448.1 CHASE3 domain-containing protein [Nitrospira sp.]HMZ55151.1 CHASE3 domain-containing protein [Nitrospira sp.]
MSLNRIYTGKGLIIALVVGFLAVEAIVAAGFLSLAHFKTSTNWATKSEQVLIELERVKSAMIDAETQQRGYLITGSEDYLPSYREAIDSLETQLRRIGSLTRDNSLQQDRVAFLATQIDQRSDELDQAIVTRRTKGLPSAKSVVSVNHQNRTMDTIQEITGQIRDEENRVLARHRADSEAWAFTTGSFAVAFFLLNAVVFTLCGVVMKLALSSQSQAERLLQVLRPSTPSAAR